ncbi:hypothetical protein HanOQP8_Chr13g0465201 [Helianthus annuus]|nr:hypothetical protein HanOQP8_Chr13g0465201 [Helianthus annuus]
MSQNKISIMIREQIHQSLPFMLLLLLPQQLIQPLISKRVHIDTVTINQLDSIMQHTRIIMGL